MGVVSCFVRKEAVLTVSRLGAQILSAVWNQEGPLVGSFCVLLIE